MRAVNLLPREAIREPRKIPSMLPLVAALRAHAAPVATAVSPATVSAAAALVDQRTQRLAALRLALGKQIFLNKAGCGGCHTLKDAGSTGTVGPNLDQLKPSQDIVEHQVENGGGPMPAFKNTLTKDEIDAVSTYVSSVAGK